MVWLYFQQGNRDHADLLLPEYSSIFSLLHQILMELLKRWSLTHFKPPDIVEAKCHLIRVPFDFHRYF